MKKFAIYIFTVTVFLACGGRQGSNTASAGQKSSSPKSYVIPLIPAMISDPAEQAEYLALHFWDDFDFTDTANIYRPQYTEQAFANYVQVLLNIPYEFGKASIAAAFSKARTEKEMFLHFAELAEKYLYDPNSPLRDEEYYISVLEAVLSYPGLDEWERIRPQEQLRMAMKNRVGTPAADFRFTVGSGATGTLGRIGTSYTLIFINNPGCAACKEVQHEIENSNYLSRLVDEGFLTILAIYPDEDLTLWRDYAPNMPSGWINAYDAELRMKNEDLYDLKAIPTLYLVDRDKTVLLKDVMSIPLIEQTIYGAGTGL